MSGTGQGFVVEGTGSRKLPRREGRILPVTVMAVLCAQLGCKSIVGCCWGRGMLKLKILKCKNFRAGLDSAWSRLQCP